MIRQLTTKMATTRVVKVGPAPSSPQSAKGRKSEGDKVASFSSSSNNLATSLTSIATNRLKYISTVFPSKQRGKAPDINVTPIAGKGRHFLRDYQQHQLATGQMLLIPVFPMQYLDIQSSFAEDCFGPLFGEWWFSNIIKNESRYWTVPTMSLAAVGTLLLLIALPLPPAQSMMLGSGLMALMAFLCMVPGWLMYFFSLNPMIVKELLKKFDTWFMMVEIWLLALCTAFAVGWDIRTMAALSIGFDFSAMLFIDAFPKNRRSKKVETCLLGFQLLLYVYLYILFFTNLIAKSAFPNSLDGKSHLSNDNDDMVEISFSITSMHFHYNQMAKTRLLNMGSFLLRAWILSLLSPETFHVLKSRIKYTLSSGHDHRKLSDALKKTASAAKPSKREVQKSNVRPPSENEAGATTQEARSKEVSADATHGTQPAMFDKQGSGERVQRRNPSSAVSPLPAPSSSFVSPKTLGLNRHFTTSDKVQPSQRSRAFTLARPKCKLHDAALRYFKKLRLRRKKAKEAKKVTFKIQKKIRLPAHKRAIVPVFPVTILDANNIVGRLICEEETCQKIWEKLHTTGVGPVGYLLCVTIFALATIVLPAIGTMPSDLRVILFTWGSRLFFASTVPAIAISVFFANNTLIKELLRSLEAWFLLAQAMIACVLLSFCLDDNWRYSFTIPYFLWLMHFIFQDALNVSLKRGYLLLCILILVSAVNFSFTLMNSSLGSGGFVTLRSPVASSNNTDENSSEKPSSIITTVSQDSFDFPVQTLFRLLTLMQFLVRDIFHTLVYRDSFVIFQARLSYGSQRWSQVR